MGKNDKVWHPLFIDYMNMIVEHENYKGLPITRKDNGDLSWIATAKSEIGKKRVEWAHKKATSLGIEIGPGVFQKVMYEIHPTKEKVCQTCGKTMSISYVYPNVSFVKKLEKVFHYETDTLTSIYEIVEDLSNSFDEKEIYLFFQKTFNIKEKISIIDDLLVQVEQKCRLGKSKLLGPGAMSNFPDRYDGFHTYNRCCRSTEDKGRSAENLKSYTKDRRAYEYWSDGNIHAANSYMGSSFFAGSSADHIGPISLGFVHDSLFLRKMSSGDNSSKRDRLLFEDIQEIINVENLQNVNGMSWYSQLIWSYIKSKYENHVDLIDNYRLALKENMTNFMYILWILLEKGGEKSKEFLIESFLKPKLEYFQYDYTFGEDGIITNSSPRNFTKATNKEEKRFYRIAFQGVDDYNAKENRNTKPYLSDKEKVVIEEIIKYILSSHYNEAEIKLRKLIDTKQIIIIEKLDLLS